jgi:hypothetical protein
MDVVRLVAGGSRCCTEGLETSTRKPHTEGIKTFQFEWQRCHVYATQTKQKIE